MSKSFTLKDSGKRQNYNSGMEREQQVQKPRFDLIIPINMPYEETLLYRWAMQMERGRVKYSNRNWEKANSIEELERFKAGAWRHFVQLMQGDVDEDHFAAVCFNLNGMLYVMDKLNVDVNGNKKTSSKSKKTS